MTQADTARTIWNRLRQAGFSEGAAAGILGNAQAESGIIADRWEGDRVNVGPGYGLLQWTPFTKLTGWASSQRLDPKALDTQIRRILWEVDNGVQFARRGQSFKAWSQSNITPEQAADDFVRYYERPAVVNSTTRQGFARNWYNQFSGKPFTTAPTKPATPKPPIQIAQEDDVMQYNIQDKATNHQGAIHKITVDKDGLHHRQLSQAERKAEVGWAAAAAAATNDPTAKALIQSQVAVSQLETADFKTLTK